MNNLHLVVNDFKFASRVIKETSSIQSAGISSTVFIAALHSEGLPVDEKISDNIIVHRFRLKTRKLSKSLPVQLLKYFEYCFRVFFYYRNHHVRIINIHTEGLLPLGLILKYFYRSFLVYDTHELETEKNGLHGIRKIFSKWIEKLLIKKMDQVFVASESIADWYWHQYQIKRPVVIFNARKHSEIRKSDYFRKKFKIGAEKKIFICQGFMTRGRGIPLLLDVFKERNDDSVIIFMGYGELENKIIEIARESSSVFFQPAVPPELVLNYTSSADIGIAFVENTCLNEDFAMPNKLFEYLMVGLPVIVPPLKEMIAFNEKYRFGVSAKAETVKDVNQAIHEITSGNLSQMSNNAIRAAYENSWEVQEKKMIEAYRNMLVNITGDKNGKHIS